MAVGSPAVPHSINSEGLKRRGFSPEQIRNLKNAYRVLYRSDLKLADAVEELKTRAATQPELKIFVDFIGESTRSLVRCKPACASRWWQARRRATRWAPRSSTHCGDDFRARSSPALPDRA